MAQPELTWVEGEQIQIPYTPGSAKTEGEVVVQGDIVGLCTRDLEANKLSSLVVGGGVVKGLCDNTAITVGLKVYWDDTNNVITATSTSNKLLGRSLTANGSAAGTVYVLMMPPGGS